MSRTSGPIAFDTGDLRVMTKNSPAKATSSHISVIGHITKEELLRLELTDLKELGADLELTGFDAMELADIMLGKDVEFKEYDESAADDVQMLTCPKCGHTFPK